jgi:hypothetical protein
VFPHGKQFLVSYEIYHTNPRQHANFHPFVNWNKYKKGVYYLGVKVINMLPSSDNPKKMKLIVKKFLYENNFYSLDDCSYFELQKINFFSM